MNLKDDAMQKSNVYLCGGMGKNNLLKRKDDFDLSNSRLLLFYKTENFFSPTLPENLSDFNVQVGPQLTSLNSVR